jgi:amidohydrolase
MTVANQIKQYAEQFFDEIVAFRRYMHKHPELSFKEYNTADFIEKKLKEHGFSPKRLATTGLVVLIEGNNPKKKTIALRADIDALPINEQNNCEYTSRNQGVMHACGHDVHAASLFGAMLILQKLRHNFEGTVKCIFQPGEEKLPGGASIMIQEGVLKNPEVSAIVGQHVFPELETGKVGFKPGMYMASCDEIYITVKGKGGHGAMPHQNIDPITISAQIITALQQIVSRKANPTIPCVLSIGKIIGNGATNVIPDDVYMEGTFRTMNEEWRNEAHQLIKKTCSEIAQSFGASCEINIIKGYPYLENNEELTLSLKKAAIEFLGKENVIDLPIRMTGEDFAYYSQLIPACFYRLGVRNEEKGIVHPVHNPKFNIDEQALKTGASLMAWNALWCLK